ncbi:MAG: Npt1/Npt2 family nucleotide transporter [Actinomycetota bacterium]
MNATRRLLKIHPGEMRLVAPMVALSFVGMAGLAVGQSGANALFFARIGTDALPLMYLVQGATAFAFMLALATILGRVERRRAYLAIPAGLASVVLAERLVLLTDARWIFPVLWLTVALAILLQNVFVWGTAGGVTDTRRAKRLFPLFAAGEILGSVVGGLLTDPLVHAIGTENLLLVWALALATSFVLCRVVLAAGASPQPPRRRVRRNASPVKDLRVAFGYVARSRLLVWMTLAAVLFSVLFFSLYLPWATAATERFPDAGELAGFLGLFWAAMTGAAFLVSVLVTNRLFGRFGIATMMLVLPLLYVGSFGILLASSGFVTLVVLRFVDGVWLQGVASPAWETLTNVIPDARRDQVRTFLGGGPAQAGTAIAGVIALVGQDVLSPRQFAGIGLATAAIAVYVTWRVRASYASALVDALREGRPEVFPDVAVAGVPFAFEPDAQALHSLLAAADDEQASVRRLAVQWLGEADDQRAIARLERALRDDDATVRALAVVALASRPGRGERLEVLGPLMDDPDPSVAASAAVAATGGPNGSVAARRLAELVRDPDPVVRVTVIRRLADAPADVAAQLSSPALGDEDPGVRAAAVATLAVVAPSEALGPAIRLFEDPSARVREAAARAVARVGQRSVDDALAALDRPAARDAALQALSRLNVAGREADVRRFVEQRAAEAARDDELAAAVPPDGAAAALLKDALRERARAGGRSALRALSLISTDAAAVRSAIESLDANDPGQVANALETLEATTDGTLAGPILALWEPSERANGAAGDGGPNDWLQPTLEDDDAFIAACAAAVRAARGGGDGMARARTSMPVIERVLFLRRVPLFDELAPADLNAIAEVAREQSFADGELLAAEGELGDELLIVVSGTVGVETGGFEIARRGPGEVVGEMSLITRGPRIASLVADGDVRAIRIGRREFESMIHDRPDIGIGVMRVLAHRLAESRPGDRAPDSIS